MKDNKRVAVILAAGRGSRLKELSLEHPKPMTVVNNVTIISNLVHHLSTGGIEQIIVVIGYKADRLKEHLQPFHGKVSLTFIENSIFDKTNNIYSLWLANEYLEEGFYLFEADVFLEAAIVHDFLNTDKDNVMLVDKFMPDMNGTVVSVNQKSEVLQMYLNKDQDERFSYQDKFKTVNFYKIGASLVQSFFLNKLNDHIAREHTGSYYELIIKEAIESGWSFHAFATGNRKWYEIDTKEDLERAQKIFSQDEQSSIHFLRNSSL